MGTKTPENKRSFVTVRTANFLSLLTVVGHTVHLPVLRSQRFGVVAVGVHPKPPIVANSIHKTP